MSTVIARPRATLLLITFFLTAVHSTQAGITTTGNVVPDPPTNSADLTVGGTANGTMLVNAGSVLESAQSDVGYNAGVTGSVTVDGIGSKWTNNSDLTVGREGNGTLTITAGGQVISNHYAFIAGNFLGYQGGSGVVTVDGIGSSWQTAGLLDLGNLGSGSATLNITHGAHVSNSVAVIGFYSPGAVFVDGIGSELTSSEGVIVGWSGHGTLQITGGATVNTGMGEVGKFNSVGNATVSGANSTWNASSLAIGGGDFNNNFSTGILTIGAGGKVNVGGDTLIVPSPGSSLTLDGGMLYTGGLIADFSQLNGTGSIQTHGLVTNMSLVFNQSHGLQQQFVLNGQPNQNVTINLDVDGSGSLGAGYTSPGSLTIADGLVVNSTNGYLGYLGATGTATVEGSGSTWANSGHLVVAVGSLSIASGGRVSNMNGYIINEGQVTIPSRFFCKSV